jgi:hypothetical protein
MRAVTLGQEPGTPKPPFDKLVFNHVSTLLDRHHGHVTKAAAAARLRRKHLHDLM